MPRISGTSSRHRPPQTRIVIADPVRVQLMSPQPSLTPTRRYRYLAQFVFFAIFALAGLLLFYYLRPNTTITGIDCTEALPGLRVWMTHPNYLAVGDEGEMQITVANAVTNTEAISGTLLVEFRGPAVVRLRPSASNAFGFTSLAPGEQRSTHLPFAFNEPEIMVFFANTNRPLYFVLRLTDSPTPCTPGPWRVAVTPIARLRSLLGWATSLAVTAKVLSWLWNRIR
jgi:hypothetical protein